MAPCLGARTPSHFLIFNISVATFKNKRTEYLNFRLTKCVSVEHSLCRVSVVYCCAAGGLHVYPRGIGHPSVEARERHPSQHYIHDSRGLGVHQRQYRTPVLAAGTTYLTASVSEGERPVHPQNVLYSCFADSDGAQRSEGRGFRRRVPHRQVHRQEPGTRD